jgi:hypothetical protein
MTDHHGDGAYQHSRTATHSANDDTAQTISSATHALAERLTAATNYFAAARANLAKGDYQAAEKLILRLLEQNDRVREVAEQLQAAIGKRLP